MKLTVKSKRLLWVQVMFFINSSFFMFIGFDVWEKSGSLSVYYLYFGMWVIYRSLAILLSAWFVLRDKTKELIVISYGFAFVMGIAALFGKLFVENPYILIHLYSLPLALFTTMFIIGNNQVIVDALEKDDYEGFFYTTGMFRNGIDLIVPILIGLSIYLISDIFSIFLMMAIGLVSMFISSRLPRTETSFKGKTMKDVWKQKEKGEKRKLGYLHYAFIILTSIVVQFLDIGILNYLSEAGKTELGIGLLKSFFVVLVLVVFYLKKRTFLTDKTWYFWAAITAIIIFLIDIVTDTPSWNIFVMLGMVILMYVLGSSSTSLSFKMVDSKEAFEQFSVLLKREMVRNLAKSFVAIGGFLLAFETTADASFKIFTFLVIICVFASVILYNKLDKSIEKSS